MSQDDSQKNIPEEFEEFIEKHLDLKPLDEIAYGDTAEMPILDFSDVEIPTDDSQEELPIELQFLKTLETLDYPKNLVQFLNTLEKLYVPNSLKDSNFILLFAPRELDPLIETDNKLKTEFYDNRKDLEATIRLWKEYIEIVQETRTYHSGFYLNVAIYSWKRELIEPGTDFKAPGVVTARFQYLAQKFNAKFIHSGEITDWHTNDTETHKNIRYTTVYSFNFGKPNLGNLNYEF